MSITPTARRNYASGIFDHRTRKGKGYREREFDMNAILTEITQRPTPRYNEGDVIHFKDGTQQRIVWRSYSSARKQHQYRLTTGIQNRFGGNCLSANYDEAELIQLDIGRTVPNLVQHDLVFNPATRQLEPLPVKPKRMITAVSEVPVNLSHSPAYESDLKQQLECALAELQRISGILNAALLACSG